MGAFTEVKQDVNGHPKSQHPFLVPFQLLFVSFAHLAACVVAPKHAPCSSQSGIDCDARVTA